MISKQFKKARSFVGVMTIITAMLIAPSGNVLAANQVATGGTSIVASAIPPTVTPTTLTVVKGSEVAIPIEVNLNDDTITGIKYNGIALVYLTDYTKDTTNTSLRILTPAFLGKLSVGTNKITFTFRSGATATVIVNVSNPPCLAPISPATARFVKGSAVAIPVSMMLFGDTLASIKNGTTPLVYGTDYTKSTTETYVRIISAAYLNKLPVGRNEITFTFVSGRTNTVTITVEQSMGPTVTSTTSQFVYGSAVDIPVTMTLNGDTLASIKNGNTPLVYVTDYSKSTTDANVRIINAAYLNKLPVGTNVITFKFVSGATATVILTVKQSIRPTATVVKSSEEGITIAVNLNGDTITGIKYNGTALVLNTDYTKDTTNTALRILTPAFLAKLPIGTNEITITFRSGATVNVRVNQMLMQM